MYKGVPVVIRAIASSKVAASNGRRLDADQTRLLLRKMLKSTIPAR